MRTITVPKNENVPTGLGQLDATLSNLTVPKACRLQGGIIDTQTEIKVMP